MEMKVQRQHIKNEKGKTLKIESHEKLKLKRRGIYKDWEVTAGDSNLLGRKPRKSSYKDKEKREFQERQSRQQCQVQVK